METADKRRDRTLRSTLVEVAEFVAALTYLTLVLAELEPVDRPVSTDSFSTFAVLAIMWGARFAYDHRRSGRWAMLVWGLAAAIGFEATLGGLIVVAHVVGPSVRAQAWLPPVLIGLAVTGILVVVLRRVLGESTTDGRKIALGEALGLGLIPVGIWLVSRGELLSSLGAILAIAGPLILLWMLGERRKRWPPTDSGAQV